MVKIGRMIFEERLVRGTEGNISVRVPKEDWFLVKATGISLSNLRPEDFVIVDSNGKKIKGSQDPSIETPTHIAIYQVREDVNAIVHTHQMMATAFAITGIEILPIWLRGIQVSNRIPIVKFHLPGSKELAKAVVQKMNSHKAVLLQNHGVIVVGKNIEQAYQNALVLEDLAKMQLITNLIGRPRVLTEEEIISAKYSEEYRTSTKP